MSPINKKKLNLLRKKLDKLDHDLLKIVKKRTDIVKKVLLLKSKKSEIVDKKRINIILKKIQNESIKKKIDPMITKRIWQNMIWAYLNHARKNFKKK